MVETQIINNSVENINSSVGFIGNSVSLVDQAKDTPKEVLYDFAITFLTTHTYLNNKQLAFYYISEVYKIIPTRLEFNKIKKTLSYRFIRIITKLKTEGFIVRYNNSQYKRVDLPKINTKGWLNYDGISFKNPKFYTF